MLYKLASKKKKKRNRKIEDKIFSAGLGGIGASLGHQLGTALVALPMLAKENKIDASDAEMWRAVGGKGEVPVVSYTDNPGGSFAFTQQNHKLNPQLIEHPMFTDAERKAVLSGKSFVRVGRNSGALKAHEMAHVAGPLSKSPIAQGAYGLSKTLSMVTPFVGAYMGADEGENSLLQDAALVAPSLPMLAEETRANARAAMALHRLGGKKALIAGALPILGSELSYLGMSALPVVANRISSSI